MVVSVLLALLLSGLEMVLHTTLLRLQVSTSTADELSGTWKAGDEACSQHKFIQEM